LAALQAVEDLEQPDVEELYDATPRLQPVPELVLPSSVTRSVAPEALAAGPVGGGVVPNSNPVSSSSSSESSGLSPVGSPALEPARPVSPPPVVDAWVDNELQLDTMVKERPVYVFPTFMNSESQPRQLNFDAPVRPLADQHPADGEFGRLIGRAPTFQWPQEPIDVPLPSNGGNDIIESAYVNRLFGEYPRTALPSVDDPQGFSQQRWKKRHIVTALGGEVLSDFDMLLDTEEDALNRKINKFARECASDKRRREVKFLAIVGPPMCAKSSLVRSYVSRRRRTAAVVVPSNKLLREWKKLPGDPRARAEQQEFLAHADIYVRHSSLKKRRIQVGVIDEVYNFTPLEIFLTARMMVDRGASLVLLVGDPDQREPNGLPTDHEYLIRKIQMHTSLGMPLDSHALYCRTNGRDPRFYTTTGTVATSIYFTLDEPEGYKPDLVFKTHAHAGHEDVSETVGKVQGSRSEYALFYNDASTAHAHWLLNQENRLTVAVTRHTAALVVVVSAFATAENLAGQGVLRRSTRQGSRPTSDHRLSPGVLDDLFAPLEPGKVTRNLTALRQVMSAPLALEGHYVLLAEPEVEVAETPAKGAVQRSELQALVYEGTNFDLPEPAEMDFVADAPRRGVTFAEPGPPVQRVDVRNDLDGAHLMAAIHTNSSSFDALKNILDRNVARTKSSMFTARDVSEGSQMYKRFREAFVADEYGLLDFDYAVSWLADAEARSVDAIARSEPLGETRASLRVDAEFKTQTKAKAQPGFAATLPYGQSILANSKVFNAFFSGQQPKLYRNLQKMMRGGVYLDYGMTDGQLSDELAKAGLAHLMNSQKNFQADVSRQDSSHTAAHLVAFVMVAKDCGCDEEVMDFYLAYCRLYLAASRGDEAARVWLSYILGSGDPFTLIRNDFMQLCVIACRYRAADTMVAVEKGDDIHGWIDNLLPHPLSALPSVRNVTVTVDWGAVGYHAGRFHDGQRYLVDPVRAFLKHFTRLSDENVTNSELYMSLVSRAMDYNDSEVEFLLAACQVHYPHYSADQIFTMISTMVALRERRVFEEYSVLRVKDVALAVDTSGDCAASCVRLLRPGRSKAYYNTFRGLEREMLKVRLEAVGIPCMLAEGYPVDPPFGCVVLSANHVRVRVRLKDL
jgi:hypothetical protein